MAQVEAGPGGRTASRPCIAFRTRLAEPTCGQVDIYRLQYSTMPLVSPWPVETTVPERPPLPHTHTLTPAAAASCTALASTTVPEPSRSARSSLVSAAAWLRRWPSASRACNTSSASSGSSSSNGGGRAVVVALLLPAATVAAAGEEEGGVLSAAAAAARL